MTGKHRATSGPLRKACYPPPPVSRHYGVRIMCRLCSYFSPAQKSSAGLLTFKGRGPWLFVTQHGRHKSKSRNADFIIIAHRAIPQPSGRRPVKLTNLKNPQPRRGCQPSPLNPLNLWGAGHPTRCKADFLDKSLLFLYNGSRCGDTMSIENIVEKGELLDRYGALLTDRQRDCLDLYYNENLTLAEIAGHFHISRQAVHDAMRHGEEQLMAYESALHLVSLRPEKQKAARALLGMIPEEHRRDARPLIDLLSD